MSLGEATTVQTLLHDGCSKLMGIGAHSTTLCFVGELEEVLAWLWLRPSFLWSLHQSTAKGSSAAITGMCLGACLFLSMGKLSFLKKENTFDISGTDYVFFFMGVKSGRA